MTGSSSAYVPRFEAFLVVCLAFQLSQLIVNAGGVAAMVDYVCETRGNVRLPGIMMLGYVAAHSENLAMAVIVSKVCQPHLASLGNFSEKRCILLVWLHFAHSVANVM